MTYDKFSHGPAHTKFSHSKPLQCEQNLFCDIKQSIVWCSAGYSERNEKYMKTRWEDNIKEWTGMEFEASPRATEDREMWKGIVAMSSVLPRRPPRLRDWDGMRLYDTKNKTWLCDIEFVISKNQISDITKSSFWLKKKNYACFFYIKTEVHDIIKSIFYIK